MGVVAKIVLFGRNRRVACRVMCRQSLENINRDGVDEVLKFSGFVKKRILRTDCSENSGSFLHVIKFKAVSKRKECVGRLI